MRSCKKNKQTLYYATYDEEMTVYQTDSDGNTVCIEVDGEQVPVILGTQAGYNKPVSFKANISTSGSENHNSYGEAQTTEYGISLTDYEAVINTTDTTLPITETSLIWHTSKPTYNSDGTVNGDSADYRVLSIRKSLHTVKYLLKQLPED